MIQSTTRLEAWCQAVQELLDDDDRRNVILRIDDPVACHPNWPEARDELDDYYADNERLPIHAVAETIFPGWEYAHRGPEGVYEFYPEEKESLEERDPGHWGTYAERLTSPDGPEGEFNPIQQMIDKMREAQGEDHPAYRAAYELSLYRNADDHGHRRGGPCLSHLSFKLIEGKIHLTALYRLHDYRFKTPGNLLGLARLQAFVANEVDVDVGELVVHSTLAYLGSGGRIEPFREALESIEMWMDDIVQNPLMEYEENDGNGSDPA